MVDEHDAGEPRGAGVPLAGADPLAAEHTRPADARQKTEGADDGGLPTGNHSGTAGATGDSSLYDRLAAKDREPAGEGGDSPTP